jgi:hypothetical protein
MEFRRGAAVWGVAATGRHRWPKTHSHEHARPHGKEQRRSTRDRDPGISTISRPNHPLRAERSDRCRTRRSPRSRNPIRKPYPVPPTRQRTSPQAAKRPSRGKAESSCEKTNRDQSETCSLDAAMRGTQGLLDPVSVNTEVSRAEAQPSYPSTIVISASATSCRIAFAAWYSEEL